MISKLLATTNIDIKNDIANNFYYNFIKFIIVIRDIKLILIFQVSKKDHKKNLKKYESNCL